MIPWDFVDIECASVLVNGRCKRGVAMTSATRVEGDRNAYADRRDCRDRYDRNASSCHRLEVTESNDNGRIILLPVR